MKRICVLIVLAAALTGCANTNNTASPSPQAQAAMAALPENVRSDATQYTTGLTQLSAMLARVQSSRDALGAVRAINPSISQINLASVALKGLDPDTKKQVLTAYGSQIASSNDAFTTQLERIRGDAGGGLISMSSILGPTLDRVTLFK